MSTFSRGESRPTLPNCVSRSRTFAWISEMRPSLTSRAFVEHGPGAGALDVDEARSDRAPDREGQADGDARVEPDLRVDRAVDHVDVLELECLVRVVHDQDALEAVAELPRAAAARDRRVE